MTISFPGSPSDGQVYSPGGGAPDYIYSSAMGAWQINGVSFLAPTYLASPPPVGSTTPNTGEFTGFFETRVTMGANNIDLNAGSFFTKTISSNATLTISNVPTSGTVGSFILELTNGGAYSITWWSGIKWANGLSPSLTVSGLDVLGFYTMDGGTSWRGLVLGSAMA